MCRRFKATGPSRRHLGHCLGILGPGYGAPESPLDLRTHIWGPSMAERAIDTVKVLVVDDDPEVAETVQMAFSLRWPESEVVRTGTGHGALESVLHGSLDIVVLDVILPDTDGFAVLRGIRAMSRVPVIMLTVRASVKGGGKVYQRGGAKLYHRTPQSECENLVVRVSQA